MIGIVTNVLLAAFKALVGVLSSSIAIVMDAVNNLSDALSSVITIIGTKLSQRPADRKHPFGYGRVNESASANALRSSARPRRWKHAIWLSSQVLMRPTSPALSRGSILLASTFFPA